MIRVQTFPARDGDCTLLSYGDTKSLRHVLVDGGRTGTYNTLRPALQAIAKNGGKIELLVLTHVDADHIEGALKLIRDPDKAPVEVEQVWFNGYEKLATLERLGYRQGDTFSDGIRERGWPWNTAFDEGCVVLDENQAPKQKALAGGLQLTLLSPDRMSLTRLRSAWEKSRETRNEKPADQSEGLEAMGARAPMPVSIDVPALAAEPQNDDDNIPNSSSIAFVAEWEGKRILMAADAHPDTLARGLRQLAGARKQFRVDVYKVSHHGSARNNSRDLLGVLDCSRFLFSTDGSRNGHPNPQTVARILTNCNPGRHKTLYFNYRQDYSTPWDRPALRTAYSYECEFPTMLPEGQLEFEV